MLRSASSYNDRFWPDISQQYKFVDSRNRDGEVVFVYVCSCMCKGRVPWQLAMLAVVIVHAVVVARCPAIKYPKNPAPAGEGWKRRVMMSGVTSPGRTKCVWAGGLP